MSALSILLIGLLLGMKHATEADHLAAVATLATRQASLAQTLRLGLAWGVGHTLTLMLFAGAVLALGLVISPSLEQALETLVGLMLVGLGVDVLRRLRRERIHFHAASAHRHPHGWRWPVRALAVGMMHGLAGSAALVLLSLQAVPSVPLGLAYIALFGVGSIVGMALLSVVIALPLRLSAAYLSRLHQGMTVLVGVGSCALGVFMVVQIGYLRSLLA
ncbi:MAG: hypothetical protein RLY71_198 [Pseudomonadota bacterium]|jgi:hypothetical protein